MNQYILCLISLIDNYLISEDKKDDINNVVLINQKSVPLIGQIMAFSLLIQIKKFGYNLKYFCVNR